MGRGDVVKRGALSEEEGHTTSKPPDEEF